MAQLDHNIFLQQQAPDLSKAGDGFERGLRIGDMMKDRKAKDLELQKKQQIDDSFKAGQVTNPDGTISFDGSLTVKDLMGKNPQAAIALQDQFRQQDIAKQHEHAEMTFNESMKALQNPAYYQTAVDNLVKAGAIKLGEAPPVFDEGFVKTAAYRSEGATKYLANKLQEQHYKNEEENRKLDRSLKYGELNDRRDERKTAAQLKQEEKEATLAVPGFKRTGEVLPRPEEAAKLRDAVAFTNTLVPKLKEMATLVDKYGSFEWGGDGAKKMASLAKEIQLSGKGQQLYDLGVLNGPDLQLLETITSSPDSFDSLMTKDSTRKTEIATQLRSIQEKLKAKAESMGYKNVSSVEEAVVNAVKKEFNPGINKTRITYSNGKVEEVDGRQ